MKNQIVTTQLFLLSKIKFTILHQLEIKIDKKQRNHWNNHFLHPHYKHGSKFHFLSIIKRLVFKYL